MCVSDISEFLGARMKSSEVHPIRCLVHQVGVDLKAISYLSGPCKPEFSSSPGELRTTLYRIGWSLTDGPLQFLLIWLKKTTYIQVGTIQQHTLGDMSCSSCTPSVFASWPHIFVSQCALSVHFWGGKKGYLLPRWSSFDTYRDASKVL